MSSFLGFFRRLLGWEEGENTTYKSSYGYHLESQSGLQPPLILSSHNVPTRDEFPWTISTTTSSPSLRSQSNTQTITTQIQPQSYLNHFKLPQTTTPSLTRATLASDNLSLCEAPKITVPESKIVTKVMSIKSETYKRKPEKLSEAFQKPNMLSPSTLKPDSSSSSSGTLLSSPEPPLNLTMHQKRTNDIWVEKGASSIYIIPDNIEDLTKKVHLSGPPPSKLKPDSTSSSSPKPHLYSGKPTLSQAPVNPTMDQKKTNYIWVEKGTSPIYKVPENVEDLIKKDILPGVLKKPLSPSTYKDFFHTMLYAEDCYFEKWDGFEMENVTLEVEDAAIYSRKGTNNNLNRTILEEEDGKVFVAFEMDSVPQNRPFLLSRDFASVRPSGSRVEPFQGIIYRVVKSNKVLVEFGEDFHYQHYRECKYNVKFSFNRVCLKRAHQAIETASDCLFKNFLFPSGDCLSKIVQFPTPHLCADDKLDRKQCSAVQQIYNHHGPPPYLVGGTLCVIDMKNLSRTGVVIREAVLQIYRSKPKARILICAPTNNTSDVLMRSLQKEIPESAMFRANAAFREIDEVLSDILPSCRIKGDCFSCPSLKELEKFKVISSTYMSCFRLHNEGLVAGHFSQIFMLDASSATEPEALVALANFADESTDVVVTGAPGNHSRWVRSNMARRNGLLRSYFERLRQSKLYDSLDPKLISQL